jgi:hypothetical protein
LLDNGQSAAVCGTTLSNLAGRGSNVTSERTELEWVYHPTDLFDAPYQHASAHFDLVVDSGRAVATLRVPQEPVSPDLEEQVRAAIESIFLVRQLLVNRKYSLEGPRIYHHSQGRTNTSIRLGDALALSVGERAHVIATDAAGNIVHDSRQS